MDWVRTIATTVEGVIAIDGKTLCNSGDVFQQTDPLHIVHAFAAENSLLLGQLATDAKSNEITAIPELLKMLTIKGNIITIDAMGCQKEIVKQIREKEGDYVIALKGNQGSLHAEAENFFQQAMEVEPGECGCDYRHFNKTLVAWAVRKYKSYRQRKTWASKFLEGISKLKSRLFVHWRNGMKGAFA